MGKFDPQKHPDFYSTAPPDKTWLYIVITAVVIVIIILISKCS